MQGQGNAVEIYLILHQHWDLAWAFQRRHMIPLLPKFFNDLLNKLRRHPSYKFVLDGQTQIIEEYLRNLPSKELSIKKLELSRYVREGKLMVGPFYSQIDWNLTDGEVWIRNLLIGHRDARELGMVMKVGWLIDIFGFPGSVPRILNKFGINSIFFTRGLGVKKSEVKDAYIWKSSNGAKVLAIYLIESYRNAIRLSKYPEIAEDRVRGELKALLPYSSTGKTILLLDGYENLTEADDAIPIIEELNRKKIGKIILCTPEEYVEAIKKHRPKLIEISGYLYHGKYATALRGVFSSRIRLKQKYMRNERYLVKWIDPLASILWCLGSEYPTKAINDLWRSLLKVASHDEICGCHIDDVYEDLMKTLDHIEDRCVNLIKKYLEEIAANIDTSWTERGLVIFNLSPWRINEVLRAIIEVPEGLNKFCLKDERGDVIPIQIGRRFENRVEIWIQADIPPLGYKVYGIFPESGNKEIRTDLKAMNRIAENKYIKLKVNDNGTLTILDKKSGHVYEELMYLKSEGEAGDLYTSYCLDKETYTNLKEKAEVQLVKSGPLAVLFKIKYKLMLPEGLTRNRTSRSKKLWSFPIIAYVELRANSPRIDVRVELNNTVKDHRLRICFPTKLKSEYVFCSQQYDIAKFPIQPDTTNYSTKDKCPLENVLPPQWDTRPADGNVHHGFIDITDGEKGLCIISRDTYEYWVNKDANTIELTLLRGVGWLGIDIPIRAGRAGWEIRTPEAQCLGRHSFELSILPHPKSWFESKLHVETEKRRLNIAIVQTNKHVGSLPSELSFIELRSKPEGALGITSIKRSEDGESLCIRVYNYLDQEVEGELRTFIKVRRAYLCNLEESIERELSIRDNNTIYFKVKGEDIITLKIEISKEKILKAGNAEHCKFIPQILPLENEDEKWLEAKSAPLITEEDILEDEMKLETLIKQLGKAKKELKNLEKKGIYSSQRMEDRLKFWETKLKVIKILERIKDTEYSLLLSKKKYIQLMERNEVFKETELRNLQAKIDEYAKKLMETRAESQLIHHVVNCYRLLIKNK